MEHLIALAVPDDIDQPVAAPQFIGKGDDRVHRYMNQDPLAVQRTELRWLPTELHIACSYTCLLGRGFVARPQRFGGFLKSPTLRALRKLRLALLRQL
jgi:hypothetical protein